MANIIANVHERFRASSSAMGLMVFKALSGTVLGVTLALIFEEIIQYGVLSFVLVTVVVSASVLKISKAWSWTHILIFDLICVLIGLLLRMYILIAPGA
jgi:hypothetical protein